MRCRQLPRRDPQFQHSALIYNLIFIPKPARSRYGCSNKLLMHVEAGRLSPSYPASNSTLSSDTTFLNPQESCFNHHKGVTGLTQPLQEYLSFPDFSDALKQRKVACEKSDKQTTGTVTYGLLAQEVACKGKPIRDNVKCKISSSICDVHLSAA